MLKMGRIRYNTYLNLLWYQAIWFLAVIGGSSYLLVIFALIILHILLSKERLIECVVMFSGAIIGGSLDCVVATLGFYQYPDDSVLPIPIWHIAIWMGFCGTLRNGLNFMVRRPRIMVPCAMIISPLIYLSAMRLNAVEFTQSLPLTLICVSIVWMVSLVSIIYILRWAEEFKVFTHQITVK